ncbi:hypothetical protein BKA93DRAFT_730318 [Sparassis latifolia]
MYWQTINTTELIVIPTEPTATRTLGRSLLYTVLLLIVAAFIVENTWIATNCAEHRQELERWERERKDLERQREEERQQWEREKREDERRRREEERRRLGLYWDEPQAKNCVSYGTREHTARLRNIPSGYNWVQACEEMSIEIHKRTIDTPSRCEDAGASGIFGHWQVGFEEPACVPYWGDLYDKVCFRVQFGVRFEARLWNLQKDDDWTNMCGTTPAVIHGVHHAKPTYCEYRGAFYGMVGMWDQSDNRCR